MGQSARQPRRDVPTPEHLRKAALIATGWHREAVIEAGAQRRRCGWPPTPRGQDEFAHVVTRGPTVTVRWARSQRMHGLDRMDKGEFQKSKDDILGWISNLIGVEPEQLRGGVRTYVCAYCGASFTR